MRTPDGVHALLAQADVAHVAGLDHVGDCADGVFNRHARVESRDAVDVDVVGAQALQRVGQEILHRGGPAIHPTPAAAGRAQCAELDRQQRLVAPARESAAEQHFVVAHAVEVAGVDQVEAGVERGVDGGDALCVINRAVHARHAHGAQADGGNGLWTVHPESGRVQG